MHEAFGHGSTGEMGLFDGNVNKDHAQFTDLVTNQYITLVSEHRASELPPPPITISRS